MRMRVRSVMKSLAFGNSSVDLVVCACIFRTICGLAPLGRGAALRDHSSSGPRALAGVGGGAHQPCSGGLTLDLEGTVRKAER